MPILLFLFIPFKKVLPIKLICSAAIIQITALSLINYADTQYFNMFRNHITVEIWTAAGHIDFLIKFVLSNYFKSILIFSISAILIIKFINGKIGSSYGKLKPARNISAKRYVLFLFIYVIAAFIFVRGNLNPNDRPIRTLDAFLNTGRCGNTGGGIPPIFL